MSLIILLKQLLLKGLPKVGPLSFTNVSSVIEVPRKPSEYLLRTTDGSRPDV